MIGLRVEHLRKTFNLSKKQRKIERTDVRRKIAVDDVSFEAKPGEIFGLLGPNGAGKTTALRCIATLIKPDSGDVFVGEHSAVKDSAMVRKNIAFLTNEMKLEDHFTPNYLFTYFARLHGVDEADIEPRKAVLFERFGVDKFREVKVADLSTGMKQKVSIAVSLVHDPDTIIFDEPTNGLDVLTARTVTDYLQAMAQAGKTVIMSTHILHVAQKLCDRIGIIIGGKIKALDTIENIRAISPNEDMEALFFKLVEESEAPDYA